ARCAENSVAAGVSADYLDRAIEYDLVALSNPVKSNDASVVRGFQLEGDLAAIDGALRDLERSGQGRGVTARCVETGLGGVTGNRSGVDLEIKGPRRKCNTIGNPSLPIVFCERALPYRREFVGGSASEYTRAAGPRAGSGSRSCLSRPMERDLVSLKRTGKGDGTGAVIRTLGFKGQRCAVDRASVDSRRAC